MRILGVGNGDPAWQGEEQPTDRHTRTFRVSTFNGLAQILLQATHEAGTATLTCSSTDKTIRKLQLTIGN